MSDNPSEKTTLPKVAHIVDAYKIVINQGGTTGIRVGQRFLIFALGPGVNDPETKEPLGELEIVRGTGRVTHAQDFISTIETDMKAPGRQITKTPGPPGDFVASYLHRLRGQEIVTETEPDVMVPFDNPQVGDSARPL